ncbi:MAG TPA: enoyl-CoA hydratase/isomerase family protein [Gaiellaceae bacterium]|nr:enoyl-CoA hydratase/isomerase family protein [Gaiellaceae bacterium]
MLEAAGLSPAEIAAWEESRPSGGEGFAEAARLCSDHLAAGERLLARLPARPDRSETEAEAAARLREALDAERVRFLRAHAEDVYLALTDGLRRAVRDEELVYAAAERFPGLVPTRAQVAAERERALPDKEGVELAQGLFFAHVLASPRCGSHLLWAMLRPTAEALERLDDFRATGVADLGGTYLERRDGVAHLEIRNDRHLNAEDSLTLPTTEVAVDLALLDPEVSIGLIRGAVVSHPRYAGRRVFGAGVNLTHLYHGRLDFMFFVTRDLGYVNKLFRGLSADEHRPGDPEETTEKLWVAAVETFAIGGACQILHTVDHVIAERGARLFLPARKEGILPGASNLRLPRSVGDRLARQAILSGLEFEAGTPHGDLLVDEVVEPGAMDAAIAARVAALTDSGLVNAAGNRRALRVGAEPLDLFRRYMSVFCREQAYCHFSPALVRNLEQHWNAREREA